MWEVAEWVWEQGEHLTPSQHHLLTYLSMSSVYSTESSIGRQCQVMTHRSTQNQIAASLGMPKRTVRRALYELVEKRYVVYRPSHHPEGLSEIYVLWDETFDEMRKKHRMGLLTTQRKVSEKTQNTNNPILEREDNVVHVQF